MTGTYVQIEFHSYDSNTNSTKTFIGHLVNYLIYLILLIFVEIHLNFNLLNFFHKL